MGMFDYLACKHQLPMKDAATRQFQTKDLECMMDNYEIREDGTLWREAYESHIVERTWDRSCHSLPRR
jgi:hypothetical protein